MMHKILLSSAAILAIFAAPAFAADLPSRQAPPVFVPPPLFTWTGVYLGGQIGYETGRYSTWAPGVYPIVSSWPDGIVGGAHAGYNYQLGGAFNTVVVGLEGDVNGSSYSGGTLNGFTGVVLSTKTPIDGSIRGRFGVAVGRALLYVTGGAAFADLRETYTGTGYTLSHGRIGWTGGGGVEYALTNNWSVRVEYRYTDYGTFSDLPGASVLPRIHHETDSRVQAGFSYKFDTSVPLAPVVAKY